MEKSLEQNTNALQLREAQMDDAPLLVSILKAAFAEYQGKLDPPSGVHNETVESVQHKLQKGRAVIAFLGTAAAGCVFYLPESGYVYLGRLSVLPQYRRQGIAGALLDYVEQQAIARNTPFVQLGVRLALHGLLAFYTSRGYRVLRYGTHEGYPEPTYQIMEKSLG